MNQDLNQELPPNARAELEARVTSLLLGELSAEDAAAMRQIISQDAALAKLHERLRLTLDLVRESAASSAGEISEQTAPLKLSPARREALLAHFKTVAPQELVRPRDRRFFLIVELAAAAAIVLMLAALLLPALSKGKSKSMGHSFVTFTEDRGFFEPTTNGGERVAGRAGDRMSTPSTSSTPSTPSIQEINRRAGDLGLPRRQAALAQAAAAARGTPSGGSAGAASSGNNVGVVNGQRNVNRLGLNLDGEINAPSGSSMPPVAASPPSPPRTTIYTGKTEESENPNYDQAVALANKVLADHGLAVVQDGKVLNIMTTQMASENAATPAGDESRRLGEHAAAFSDDQNNAVVVSAPLDAMPGLSNLILNWETARGANDTYPNLATQGQVGPVTFTIDPISRKVTYITPPQNQTAVGWGAGDTNGGVYSIHGVVDPNWSSKLHSAGNEAGIGNQPGNIQFMDGLSSQAASYAGITSDDMGGFRYLLRTNDAVSGIIVAGGSFEAAGGGGGGFGGSGGGGGGNYVSRLAGVAPYRGEVAGSDGRATNRPTEMAKDSAQTYVYQPQHANVVDSQGPLTDLFQQNGRSNSSQLNALQQRMQTAAQQGSVIASSTIGVGGGGREAGTAMADENEMFSPRGARGRSRGGARGGFAVAGGLPVTTNVGFPSTAVNSSASPFSGAPFPTTNGNFSMSYVTAGIPEDPATLASLKARRAAEAEAEQKANPMTFDDYQMSGEAVARTGGYNGRIAALDAPPIAINGFSAISGYVDTSAAWQPGTGNAESNRKAGAEATNQTLTYTTGPTKSLDKSLQGEFRLAVSDDEFAGDLNGGVLPNAATANAWSEVAKVVTPPAADRFVSREAFVNSGTINLDSVAELTNDLKLGDVPVPGHLYLSGGAIGAQAGTAPSYTGNPVFANPSGIFPGTLLPGTNSLAFVTENAGKVAVNYAVASPPASVVAPAAPAATNGFLERLRRAVAGNVAASPAPVEGGLIPTNTPPPMAMVMMPTPLIRKPQSAILNSRIDSFGEAAVVSAIRNPQSAIRNPDAAPPKPAIPPPVPQPEVQTRDNAFSTFSLNVSDVSFKLAAASLQDGVMPDAATVRSEEFINAFDYRDSEPVTGAPIGFSSERAGYPFAHNRDLLRFAVKAAAEGRQAGRPLNLVLLLDKSGSMERADRVAIIREALRVLAAQLKPQDTISVVVFARTARLFADGVSGSQFGALAAELEAITPEGGTNLEEAMRLAYETALRHYLANGENRVVVLTDGAANLGNVEPDALKKRVEANRAQGIALDCFGVGWEDYNDTLLETLSRGGGGRYGFVNTPEEAATGFAGQLAGALRVAASDVKVQVEFNPDRVISWRQIGYAKDQLTQEQFRDNSVKAAQISVAESGNALYTVELNPAGDGPVCVVYVRYRAPGTSDYYERAWAAPYTGAAETLDKASPAMRLAATASAFSEWLAGSPYAGEVTLNQLQGYLRGVPEFYGADTRPGQLETMLREARSISGK